MITKFTIKRDDLEPPIGDKELALFTCALQSAALRDWVARQLAQPAAVVPDPARAWLTVAKAEVEQRLAKARERFQQANDHDRQAPATA